MFFVEEGFTYRNFLMDMIAVFAFVVWFWLLVVIYGDLFRRHDISGWGKALWVLALVVTSYFGIFAYLITHRNHDPDQDGRSTAAQGIRLELDAPRLGHRAHKPRPLVEYVSNETLSRCFGNRRQPVRTSCARQRCLGSQGAGLRSGRLPRQSM